MRRTAAVLTLLALLVLPSCGGDGAGSADTGGASASAGAGPSVTGGFGQKPTVKAPKGAPGAALIAKSLHQGDGPAVAKGDLLVADYSGQTWREDKVFDSSFDRGQPVSFPIGVGKVIAGWDESLVGVKAGSRMLLVIPPDMGYGAQGQPQAGIKGDDTLVFVVDVLGSYGGKTAASGAPGKTPAAGLPTVTAAAGTKPTVRLPAARPPKALLSTTLMQGEGPAVRKGQLLVAQYVGVIWPGGKEFDSSWDRGQPAAFTIGTGQVIPGWDKTLVGVKSGSRVLLTIPPADGYGAAGQSQAGIRGSDTLVFVVDVLGSFGRPAG